MRSSVVRRRLLIGSLACAWAAALACGDSKPPIGPDPTTTTTTPAVPPEVLVGAGDIGMCGPPGSTAPPPVELTARLLDGIDGTVFTAGDNAYPQGSPQDFLRCYDPYWGRHKLRTRPSPGNHDYETGGGSAYFTYFGESAAPPQGYYSYDLGAWHILSLNSNVPASAGSPQYAFVARDLARNQAPCTLAVWHHPLFSSGQNGPSRIMADIFRLLYDGNVDVVLNGHDHWYERFAPQTPDGALDTARGILQIVVGTGGATLTTGRGAPQPNSERRLSQYGVLKLNLTSTGYDGSFVQTNGGIGDFFPGRCH